MKNRSNRDKIGAPRLIFCRSDFALLYRPLIGFAAANIEVLAFNVALTPAYKYILAFSFAFQLQGTCMYKLISNTKIRINSPL